jgi:hypothetical protein
MIEKKKFNKFQIKNNITGGIFFNNKIYKEIKYNYKEQTIQGKNID